MDQAFKLIWSFQYGRIQAFFSIILLLCFPVEVVSVLMTALGFIMLRNFRNRSKTYYYTITISNVIGLIFQDVAFGFPSLFGVVSTNLSDLVQLFNIPLYIRPLLSLNIVTCSILYYLRDIGSVCQIWTTCMFGIHRALIVMLPFKTNIVTKLLNKWTLLMAIFIAGCFYIPDFFLGYIYTDSGQNFCIFSINTLAPFSFLKLYFGQLFFLTIIAPILIICITTGVILTYIRKSFKMRSQFNKINSHKDNRSNTISIVINITYIIFIGPIAIMNIIFSLLNNCVFIQFVVSFIIYNLLTILQYNSLIVRMTDGFVFFLMIPEFRKSTINFLKCRILIKAVDR